MPPSLPNESTSKKHVFAGVTFQALQSLRGEPGGDYAIKLDPDSVGGLLTTHTGMGDVVLRFDHDNEREELTLTIVKKPMLLPTAAIWAATSHVLRRASEKAESPTTAKPPRD